MPKELIAQKITFLDLCSVFQAIRNSLTSAKRLAFDKFYRQWTGRMMRCNEDGSYEYHTEDDFYPAMRLFVPSIDERSFGIKEARLNALVCKVLMVKPLDNCNSIPAELLVERLVAIIDERFTGKKRQFTIYEINESLNRLIDTKQRDAELLFLFTYCSTTELRWIFHILINNMGRALAVPHPSTILNWMDRDGDRRLRAGDSLRAICESVAGDQRDGPAVADANSHQLLCKPFKPMLLKRLNYNKDCLPQIIKHCRRPFYMELKYDGEHIMLHKFAGSAYKYFTRNGVDYTQKLGGDASTRLSAKIHSRFADSVKDCVLDCELLVWDSAAKCFLGKNRRAYDGRVYDAKHLDEDFFNNTVFERCLVAFDVLYLNGRTLVDVPLHERVEILERDVFNTLLLDKSTIFVSEKRLVATAREFTDFYNQAMRNGEEGVVVKAIESTLVLGSRAMRNGWFKIKPDYGVQSVLDLAVVGLCYENTSTTKVRSFLVAAAEGAKADMRFRIVAGITTYLKKLDFMRLMQLLQHDVGLVDAGEAPPPWIVQRSGSGSTGGGQVASSQLASARSRADRNVRYVARQNLQVVEVRASSVLNGHLQFPSISCIRSDKFVEDIDTVQDVLQFDERLRSRPMIDEDDPHEAILLLNRKRRNNLKLKEDCKILRQCDVEEQLGDALKGRNVCVLNAASGTTVQDLQKILLLFGANVIANASKTTDFVVAMTPRHIKCAAAVKADLWHVVDGTWLLRCRDKAKILPWADDDMIHKSSNATFEMFGEVGNDDEEELDQDNNEVLEYDHQLYDAIKAADRAEATRTTNEPQEHVAQPPLSPLAYAEEVEKLNDADCERIVRGNLFEGFTFFVHASICKLGARAAELREKVLQESGVVSGNLDATVTHVLVDLITNDEANMLHEWNERDKSWAGVYVSMEWVDESVANENRYLPTENIIKFLI